MDGKSKLEIFFENESQCSISSSVLLFGTSPQLVFDYAQTDFVELSPSIRFKDNRFCYYEGFILHRPKFYSPVPIAIGRRKSTDSSPMKLGLEVSELERKAGLTLIIAYLMRFKKSYLIGSKTFISVPTCTSEEIPILPLCNRIIFSDRGKPTP